MPIQEWRDFVAAHRADETPAARRERWAREAEWEKRWRAQIAAGGTELTAPNVDEWAGDEDGAAGVPLPGQISMWGEVTE